MSNLSVHKATSILPLAPVSQLKETPTDTSLKAKPKHTPEISPSVTKSESQQVQTHLENVKPSKMMSTHESLGGLLKPQGLSVESKTMDLKSSYISLNKSMEELQCTMNKFQRPIKREGKMILESSAGPILSAQHNPLASAQDKLESELFRAFLITEFSTENSGFFDGYHSLKNMDVQSEAFDSKMLQLFENYQSTRGSESINISSSTRTQAEKAYSQLKEAKDDFRKNPSETNQAKLNHARMAMMASLKESFKEIDYLMSDSLSRYGRSKFKGDIQSLKRRLPFNLGNLFHMHKATQGKNFQETKTIVKGIKKNRKAYRTFKQEKTLKMKRAKRATFLQTEQGQKMEANIQTKEKAWGVKRGTWGFTWRNIVLPLVVSYGDKK